jgi:hypothetical protein
MGDASPETDAAEVGRYANFLKVGYTEYEFLLDFGQSFGHENRPHVHTRIVTTPAHANAIFRTLRDSVEEFEARFGTIADLESET